MRPTPTWWCVPYQGSYGGADEADRRGAGAGSDGVLVYNNWTAAFWMPVPRAGGAVFDHGEHGLSQAERDDYVASFVAANTWDGVGHHAVQ